jgi:hypothetical protein
MKKTPVKMIAIKAAWFVLAAFISFFSIGSSAVIFWRTIEIVQGLDYTKNEEYAILGFVGLVLMWLCSLAASSAENIILKQLIKEQKSNG